MRTHSLGEKENKREFNNMPFKLALTNYVI